MEQNFNNFFDNLDCLVNGTPVKEELDNTSTTDEFIEVLAKNSADFIKSNRNAFNLDDREAVSEFIKVIGVDSVTSRIFDFLQSNEESKEVEQSGDNDQAEAIKIDASAEVEKPSDADSEYVSEDIMKMLDE